MRFYSRIIFLAPILLSLFVHSNVFSQGRVVYRIQITDDIISPVIAEYVSSSIKKAQSDSAVCLIVELDTPGGLLSSTRTIVRDIMNARVPVVVYVAPRGARAGSAGVFITLAAHIAAMAPSTNIGAAHPVELDDRRPASDSFEELAKRMFSKKEDKETTEAEKPLPAKQKVLNDTKAWAEAIARERGRNSSWAIKAVEESVSVSDSEALRDGIIDVIADDAGDLVAKLDGRQVRLPNRPMVIETSDVTIIDIPKTFRLRWLSALAHPNIAYILLMLGFYGLLFEFTHPGIGFPGIAGAICLILAFFGLQVLPTNYAGVALIVLAIGMFIAEVKITSYGLLTLGGIATLLLGSLILFPSPYEFMRVSLPIILSFTGATLAIAMFLTFIVVRSQKHRVTTGAEGLVGEAGEVKIWKGHHGTVFVHGELWGAYSDTEFLPGTQVEIIAIDGMVLRVRSKGD